LIHGVALDYKSIRYNQKFLNEHHCCRRTPLDTLLDGKAVWDEKNLTQI
jgi:hypothetical protein